MQLKIEIEFIVFVNRSGIGNLSFLEERKFQNYFINIWIEITVLDMPSNDNFFLFLPLYPKTNASANPIVPGRLSLAVSDMDLAVKIKSLGEETVRIRIMK